jgi:allantoate deiminase
MDQYLSRPANILKRIEELSAYSEDEHGTTRLLGTKSFIDCGEKIFSWMADAGLEPFTDNIGNIRGKLLSEDPHAKTFVIASHFDSDMNAGKFDGPLGILIGLDIVENIIKQKIKLPFHFEIIAFSAEKGARFHSKYLAGKVLAGTFKKNLLEINDEDGNTLSTVLESMNLDVQSLHEGQISDDEWLGYFEIDIEAGPVLYEKNIPVGVVNSIAGQRKIVINFVGETGNAGTFPMSMRRDALCAAAQFILEVEEYASREKRNLIATVGEIEISNASSNLIPARVSCVLDMRSSNNVLLSEAYENINLLCEDICDKRKIYFEWKLAYESDAVDCDEQLRTLLAAAVKSKNIELTEMVSGVGRTAAVISKVAPVVILFVKCFKGISDHPMENVKIEDIAAALEVSDVFVQNLKELVEKNR